MSTRSNAAVVSVGFIKGGAAYNVIPDDLHIGGTARSFRPEVRDLIEARLGEIARGVAALHGASAEAEYRRNYPPTINHQAETEFAAEVAAEICGPDQVIRDVAPSMGAEDFSFYQQKVPGLFFWLGTRPRNQTPEEAASNHSPLFYVDESGLGLGIRAMARVALDYLRSAAPSP